MVDIDAGKDYYKLLEVSPTASEREIRSAYRQLARQYHPDTGHGDVERFRLVQEAYEILSDVTYRRAYDQQRASRGLSRELPVAISFLMSREALPLLDGEQMFYVLTDINPQSEEQKEQKTKRSRLNVALVIDRSTSMRGARMQNVQMAAMDMLDALGTEDRLAVVTFSDRAEVVAPSTSGTEKRLFRSAIASIAAGGGTEIYQGLAEGIKQVEANAGRDTINHVILLTDGRTYGDEAFALAAARKVEAQGITISAFGIGEDWNDTFLDNLAHAGGGTSHYIDAPNKIREILKTQVEGLANLALRKVRLRINAAPYVRLAGAYRAAPYMELFYADQKGVVSVGSITSGEPSTLLFEFAVRQSDPGERRIVRLELEGEVVASGEQLRVSQDVMVTFTQAPDVEPVPPRLLTLLSRLSIFRLQERAWRALDDGNTRRATQYLESAATHLFDLGYRELGHAAMLEVGRLSQGNEATTKGRKKLRYGTRALSIPAS